MAVEEEVTEGMSTPKKVVTGAAVGLATAAAVGVGKKLLGSDDDSDSGGDSGGSQQSQGRSRRTGGSTSGTKSRSSGSSARTKARSTSGLARRTSSSASRRSSGGATKTKEQLYAQAKRLKIEGRSSMTKQQLERAVARAKG